MKVSQAYELLTRLQNRLKLKDVGNISPQPLALAEGIVPITNFDELAKNLKIEWVQALTFTGTGYKAYFAPPKGKICTIRALRCVQTGGTLTMNAFGIYNASASVVPNELAAADSIPITSIITATTDLNTCANSISYGNIFPLKIPYPFAISISIVTNTAGTCNAFTLFEEEDLY